MREKKRVTAGSPREAWLFIFSAINIFLRPRCCGGEVKRNPAFLPSRIYIRRRTGEGGRSIPGICVNLGNHFGILYTFKRSRRPFWQVLHQLFPESVRFLRLNYLGAKIARA